jgi:acetyltransferase-like isoleucine patch superfamily enzyme
MPPRSHGTGQFDRAALRRCPASVIVEPGALVFHPENVSLDEDVYVGHYAILKGYHRNELVIGRGAWIGQAAFLHAAGGIRIGEEAGIGPHVCVLTSVHAEAGRARPVMAGALELAPVVLDDGCDIGVGAIILPGVTVGKGAQVGAGAVVTADVPAYAVVAGNPARVLRMR